ncbi:acyl-CoA N-acyltransferase [Glonium stellatum]|uniref:Acyl-CoA N-acyltransferase n=1 Tax=Glonium stellatum TaxID=574774 RepID=A0A8E2ESN8_9PEZI|nr:acyl-CoA N-acyltransferase [Glonium stellatum]
MHIRPLIRSDIPAVAEITNQTFSKDELFTWLYPHQSHFPDDLRRFQLIRLRTRLVEQGSHGFVAESEEGDAEWTGKPEVLGFAFYIRNGDDPIAEKWRKDPVMNNRASDRSRALMLGNATEYNIYSQLSSYWHLGLLGVSPRCQRRGIGAKLVSYGQEIAAEENVPVTLEASVMGRLLYAKMGFRIVEESKIIEGLEGVAMLWEPKGSGNQSAEEP